MANNIFETSGYNPLLRAGLYQANLAKIAGFDFSAFAGAIEACRADGKNFDALSIKMDPSDKRAELFAELYNTAQQKDDRLPPLKFVGFKKQRHSMALLDDAQKAALAAVSGDNVPAKSPFAALAGLKT